MVIKRAHFKHQEFSKSFCYYTLLQVFTELLGVRKHVTGGSDAAFNLYLLLLHILSQFGGWQHPELLHMLPRQDVQQSACTNLPKKSSRQDTLAKAFQWIPSRWAIYLMSIRHMTATEKIPLAMKTENRFMQYESRCARLNYISFFTFLPLLKFQANLKVDLLHPSSKITSLLIQATSYLTDC